MNMLGTRLTTFMLALSMATGMAISTLNVAAASAQQNADIYAVADLTPDGTATGTGAEGSISTATFERLEKGGTRVTLVLMNTQAGASYQADIRDGSCGGVILYTLSPMQSDASGESRAVTELPADVEFGRWYVEVHSGDAGSGSTVLCGQVNPAIAGAPPIESTPGMPRTGQGFDAYWLGLLGAALALLGFISHRRAEHL